MNARQVAFEDEVLVRANASPHGVNHQATAQLETDKCQDQELVGSGISSQDKEESKIEENTYSGEATSESQAASVTR